MALTTLSPGMIFASDFRILQALAEGGMGAVYVAEQISTGKWRALKTMHPQFVSDAGLRERFAQEARIGARIDSEHVVDVVAAGVDAATGMPWLAMELLRGESIADAVTHGHRGDLVFASHVLHQLGEVLAAAHAVHVVHRDLKPENLFLGATRHNDVPFVLKVLDFGIAKLVSERTTHATAAVGTPMWMAPEQTEIGVPITACTDVWAYGLVAFFVLTGKSYWKIEVDGRDVSAAVLMRQVVLDPLPRASDRARELGVGPLPAEFDAWFERCVARDPRARFADGAAALAALDSVFPRGRIASVSSQTAFASTLKVLPSSRTLPLAPTPKPPTMPTHAGISTTNPVTIPTRRWPWGMAAVASVLVGLVTLKLALHAPVAAQKMEKLDAAVAVPSTVKVSSPRNGALFASSPIQLGWQNGDGGAVGHDIEVARASEAADAGHAPPGATYVMWPWHEGRVAPGAYSWRVREAGSSAWSEWTTFSFYPSVLDRIEDQKTIRIGVELTYHEPFAYWDPRKNQLVGFDIDLIDALAVHLGVKAEIATREWSALFQGVENRDFDAVVSAVSVTKDRAKKYGFSDAYLKTGVVVTTRAGSEKVSAPGVGKTVGAQKQTTAAQTAHTKFGKATVKEFETLDAALAALSRSEIDALLSDETVIRPRREVKDGTFRVEPALLSDDAYAVMMPIGDDRWRARMNTALKELKANGKIAELKAKYGLR